MQIVLMPTPTPMQYFIGQGHQKELKAADV
jgi:hypothetical protein